MSRVNVVKHVLVVQESDVDFVHIFREKNVPRTVLRKERTSILFTFDGLRIKKKLAKVFDSPKIVKFIWL